MMGSENQEEEEAQMESVKINDDEEDLTSKSYANYRSAMSTLSASDHHPLATPAHSDPLLSAPTTTSPARHSPHADVISPVKAKAKSGAGSSNPSFNANEAPLMLSPSHSANGGAGSSNPGLDDDDEEPSEASSSVMLPQSSSSTSDYLKITVSDPKKEVESTNSIVPGGNTYTTYQITTETNIEDYGGSKFSVRRRFRDVVTLSDRLTEAYRGFFIPPRPDKSVVESQVMQKQEFVEQRRVALEKYLRRLAMHPVIKKSDELRVFLQVQGRLPLPTSTDMASRMLDGAVKLPKQLLGGESTIGLQDVVQPAKSGRDLMRLFKELKQSVVNDWGGSKPAVEEEDKEFLENKEKLSHLEQQLTNVSKQAEGLVKAQQDMGETIGELGLAFIKLTKFENEHAALNTQRVRAADMKSVATATVKAGRFYRGLNAQTVKHLDTLHEYMGLMLAVHSAFSDRSSALLTVQTLVSELSALRSRAEKLETASSKIFGGEKSRVHKLEELKEAIRGTEDAKSIALKEYGRIKENNRSEIKRLDIERRADFAHMLKGFVTNQVAYAEKIGNEWAKVVEETSRYARDT